MLRGLQAGRSTGLTTSIPNLYRVRAAFPAQAEAAFRALRPASSAAPGADRACPAQEPA